MFEDVISTWMWLGIFMLVAQISVFTGTDYSEKSGFIGQIVRQYYSGALFYE